MSKINADFAIELKKYGAIDFEACYNCGSCTAVCNLAEENANFPRIFIRSGLLGQKEDILNSKELWMCYACGDCSETCPQQAFPGDYMAALRRYAIANYEPTGLTKLIFKNNPFSILFTLLIAVVLGFFLFTIKPGEEISRWIFQYMPFDVIHDIGMIIFAFTGIIVFIGILKMYLNLSSKAKRNNTEKKKKSIIKSIANVSNEISTMKRYQTCDKEEDSYWYSKPAILKPWFMHWSIMWGFIGLLLATTLNFLFKDPATDIWLPTRILGTVSGILMMYGTTLAIIYRFKKVTKAFSDTKLADWMFLFFIWIAGFTGFWIETAVFLDAGTFLNNIIFIFHTIISMELIVLFVFSKFAHAVYRPLALFIYDYKY